MLKMIDVFVVDWTTADWTSNFVQGYRWFWNQAEGFEIRCNFEEQADKRTRKRGLLATDLELILQHSIFCRMCTVKEMGWEINIYNFRYQNFGPGLDVLQKTDKLHPL